MATIIDPDNLVVGTDLIIDTGTKSIGLVAGSAITAAGATGGVTLQAVYSKLKEQWKTNATYIKFPFPMEAITPEQFEFLNGWAINDATTPTLIRNAGWTQRDSAGAVVSKFMGVISLGTIGSTDQPYYSWNGGTKTNFTFTGPVNEPVQILKTGSGAYDHTTGADTFTIYDRTAGKTYAQSNNTAIGAPTLTYQVYRFPLSNSTDLNVVDSDATIASSAPFTSITVTYYGADQSRNIDGTAAPFRIIVNDASGVATPQQIYEKIQYLLRQTADIDSGSGVVTGNTADSLASFVGSTLVGATSVAIDGLNSNYLNSVSLFDKNGVNRLYPFVAAGNITFGSNAVAGDTKYWLFFTTNPAGNFGTSTAVIVNDAAGNPITGTYTGAPVPFSYAYDTNVQGGRTAATPAGVTAVAIGLTGGQYVSSATTITRAQGQTIQLAPAQERNYVNP